MPSTLPEIRQQCADRLLHLHKRANSGHVGSSLSCLEILVDLCFGRMGADDQLVLSKGHAAPILYAAWAAAGAFPRDLRAATYLSPELYRGAPPSP